MGAPLVGGGPWWYHVVHSLQVKLNMKGLVREVTAMRGLATKPVRTGPSTPRQPEHGSKGPPLRAGTPRRHMCSSFMKANRTSAMLSSMVT